MARSTNSKPTTRKPAAKSRARKTTPAPATPEDETPKTEPESAVAQSDAAKADAAADTTTGPETSGAEDIVGTEAETGADDIISTAGEDESHPEEAGLTSTPSETRWLEDDGAAPTAPGTDGSDETGADSISPAGPDSDDEAASDPVTTEDTLEAGEVPETVDPPATVPPAPPPQQVTVQKVGFLPLAAGGAVAALVGLAAGWALFGQAEVPDLSALEAQGAQLEEFGARLDALPTAPDPAQLRAAVQGDLDTIGAEIESLRAELAALAETQQGIDGRLGAVERAPNEDGTLADEALAAFDSDFDDLRTRIGELADRIDSATAETEAALAAREEQLAAAEEAAREEARVASLRSALVELRAALQNGEPFPDTLAMLQEAGDVPAPLPELAETGAPTLAALSADFPDAARAALSEARASGEDGEDGGGIGSLFRSTFNVRSTAPREGTTVDAILSRAESALASGDLATALSEVESLPEGAAAPLADWSAAARTRLDALAAEDQLSQSLNQGD